MTTEEVREPEFVLVLRTLGQFALAVPVAPGGILLHFKDLDIAPHDRKSLSFPREILGIVQLIDM